MPETMAIISDPITDHQNPSMVTPTSNRLMASQDASSMNSQLMINAISPNERIENGNAMVCTIGLIDALINARNNANAVHAGKQCDHDPGRNGQNQPT